VTDRDAIGLTLYGEGRGEGIQGLIAIAWVLRNRVRLGRWGTTYEAVCLAPKQFSCWNAKDANSSILKAILAGAPAQDPAVLSQCYTLADVLLAEPLIDKLAGARHYYAASAAPPKWAAQGVLVASINGHKFFEGVPV
jgi:N-acetylmuramoyl-L-alanine amidase